MRFRILSLAPAVTLVFATCLLKAQTVQPLPVIEINPVSPSMIAGVPADVEVKLVNPIGGSFKAERDMYFRVSARGGRVDHGIVVIPEGKTDAHLSVLRGTPGVSLLSVQPVEASSAIPASDSQIVFFPQKSYKPLLPLSLTISFSPAPKLRAVVGKAQVLALIVDRSGSPVPAPNDFNISFPGLGDIIKPDPMQIKAGSIEGGVATLSSATVGTRPFTVGVLPQIPIKNDVTEVEFDNPIVKLRIICDPCYTTGLRRSTAKSKITVGFTDSHENWINTDTDRTVILKVDPLDAGRIATPNITILKDHSSNDTWYVPNKEGNATITPVTDPDFRIDSIQIEFHYSVFLFLIIAALGGAAGGFVREYGQPQRQSRADFCKGMVAGVIFGVIAYLLAPILISLKFNLPNLQNASRTFEAFYWGFLGGLSGAALFARLPRGGNPLPVPPAAP